MKKSVALSVALFSVASFAQSPVRKVIYGEDNRLDMYEVSSGALVEVAASTAAMIPAKDLTVSGGGWSGRKKELVISGPSLMSRGICPTERFASQPTAANCSGFIVGGKTLITAGHCVKSMSDCSEYKWVFDYKIDQAGVNKVPVKAENIYSCKRVIEQVLSSDQNDFAVIELDRPVTGRRPLTFRRSGKIAVGTPLVVIGHPSGLPTKVAGGAKVRSLKDKYFIGNLDTYGGNSGSAVLNANTLEVEGILVRGDTDYVAGPNGCRVSNVVSEDDGRGEDVTFITNIQSIKRLR